MRRSSLILLLTLTAASPVAAQSANPVVIIESSLGAIKLELYADKAPLTVKNFLQYVDERFYDGTIFHSVYKQFYVAGGAYEPGPKEKKSRPPVKSEAGNGLRNLRGTVTAMLTLPSGFFINVSDNAYIDQRQPPYTVFGQVVGGMDVVDKIKMVATAKKDKFAVLPVDDVVIRSIRLASQFTLVAGKRDGYRVGSVFTITAHVEHPVRGQALTLELPPGLERVEGKEIQPVAAFSEINASFVVWRVRGVRPGDYDCVVRSNIGMVQSKKIKVTASAN